MNSETYDERRARRDKGFNDLVGLTVTDIAVNDDQSVLAFHTDKGFIAYETEADCCSETWFADITGYDALIGNVVIAVEQMDLPEPEDDRGRQEYDQAYGAKIITSGGICDIVYRNSSNGYYGGEAYRMREFPADLSLTPITEDWTA